LSDTALSLFVTIYHCISHTCHLSYVGEFLESARANGSLSDLHFMPKYCCLPSASNHMLSELQVHQYAIHGLVSARRSNVYATASDDKSIKVGVDSKLHQR
jgi:hypothetical protein